MMSNISGVKRKGNQTLSTSNVVLDLSLENVARKKPPTSTRYYANQFLTLGWVRYMPNESNANKKTELPAPFLGIEICKEHANGSTFCLSFPHQYLPQFIACAKKLESCIPDYLQNDNILDHQY